MASIMSCIKNPVYCGILRWNTKDGRIYKQGKHDPIVSKEMFDKVQDILKRKTHVPYNLKITNPLAGLIICHYCGGRMILRPYSDKDSQIMCIHCRQNKSSKAKYIEDRVLRELENIMAENLGRSKTTAKPNMILKSLNKQLIVLQDELKEIQKQKSNLHDFLERGVYDIETFLDRESILAERITELDKKIDSTRDAIKSEEIKVNGKKNIAPLISNALEAYRRTKQASIRNEILKEFIDYIEYKKEKHQRNDEFTITVHVVDNP
jgi:hypothetical protein